MKKSLMAAALSLSSLTCSLLVSGADEVPGKEVEQRIEEVKGLDLGGKKPMVFVARDNDTWSAVKLAVGEQQKIPEGRPKADALNQLDGTDFQQQMIVAVFWGEMEFSGHGEKCWIESVVTGKEDVAVDCRAVLWGGHVYRSYRAWPYHVKVVPRSDLPVRITQTTEVKGTPLAVLKAGEWKQELLLSGMYGNANAQTNIALVGPASEETTRKPRAPTEWGTESNGLAASVRPVKSVSPKDQKIELEVFLKNVTQKDIAILGSGKRLSPSTWRVRIGEYEYGRGQPQLTSLTLKPDETQSVVLSLPSANAAMFSLNKASEPPNPVTTKHATLPEGTYKVKVGLFLRDLDLSGPFEKNQVESNEIEIRIGSESHP